MNLTLNVTTLIIMAHFLLFLCFLCVMYVPQQLCLWAVTFWGVQGFILSGESPSHVVLLYIQSELQQGFWRAKMNHMKLQFLHILYLKIKLIQLKIFPPLIIIEFWQWLVNIYSLFMVSAKHIWLWGTEYLTSVA